MKKINTSAITAGTALPFKSGSIEHLQGSIKDVAAHLALKIIGNNYDPAKSYVLWGCVRTGSGSSSYVISEGAIFFNGEIYHVPAANFATPSPNTAVGKIVTGYETSTIADPVEFTDGIQRNIHEIREVVFSSDLPGAGIVDYQNLVFISLVYKEQVLTIDNTQSYVPSSPYHPATKKYVDEKSAGLTLIGVLGISTSGALTVKQAKSGILFSSSRSGAGIYQISHNIGNTNYFVTGIGTDDNTTSPRTYSSKSATGFQVKVSDDATTNDGNIELQIFAY